MFTAISPGMGTKHHNWIKMKKKDKTSGSDVKRILAEMHPFMKESDIDVLSNFVTKRELTQYAKDSGKQK